jgi:hypothetical protein
MFPDYMDSNECISDTISFSKPNLLWIRTHDLRRGQLCFNRIVIESAAAFAAQPSSVNIFF